MLAGVAPDHLNLFPGYVQHFGRNAREIHDRVRAQIADARLNVELAVRADGHDAVPSDRAGAMRTDGDADAAHLRALPLARARLPLVPVETLGAAIECFLHERTRHVVALPCRQ